MEEYKFRVYSFHPLEFKQEFYKIMGEEKKRGNINYVINIEETAPPPELVKDIVTITASSLTILKVLYDIYRANKKKKGKVIIRINGKDFDLEAFDIDELKVKIEEETKTAKSNK